MILQRLLPGALFFLSGCASLIFETLCMRRLALVLGNTVQSASATVSAFLFGLGVGAYLGGVIIRRSANPLKAFALIEAIAGVTSWLTLQMIPELSSFLVPLAAWGAGPLLATKVLLTFVLLIVPASAMGASLPILAHYYVENVGGKFTPSLALLYSVNTLGAAFGVLATDFILVERLGIQASSLVSLTLYLLVALLAQGLAQLKDTSVYRAEATQQSPQPTTTPGEGLVVLCASGFLGLTFQILWTRMLTFFNGNDVFAFSTTLAVYLLGLVVGSALLGLSAKRWNSTPELLGTLLIAVGVTAYLSLFLIAPVRALNDSLGGSFLGNLSSNLLSSTLVMLASTVGLGLLFPLAAEGVRQADDSTGLTVGRAYIFNTLGSVLGGLGAGYLLLPKLGLQTSLAWAAGASVLLGAVLLGRRRRLLPAALLCPCLFAAILWATPQDFFLKTVYGADFPGIVFYADDHYGSVALVRGWDPALAQVTENLIVDGFNMAGNTPTAQRYTTGLAALPILLNDSADRVLIVCMGLGNTLNTAVSLQQTQHVRCVELSSRMPEMLALTEVGPRVLASPKLDIKTGDGRNYLLNTNERYNVISAEPPPPTHAGIVNLYSREYYQLCRQRLTDDGIVAQWLPVFGLADDEAKSIIKAFQEVFPYTYLWESESLQLCLLGKMQPLDLDFARLARAVELNHEFLADTGWDDAATIAALSLANPEQLHDYTQDTPPLTDDWPILLYNRHNFTVDADFLFLKDRPRLLPWKASAAQHAEIQDRYRALAGARFYRELGPAMPALQRVDLARSVMLTFPGDVAFQTRFMITSARRQLAEDRLSKEPQDIDTLLELTRICFSNNELNLARDYAKQAAQLAGPRRDLAVMYLLLIDHRSGQKQPDEALVGKLDTLLGPDADYLRQVLAPNRP